jgi:cytochrome P450
VVYRLLFHPLAKFPGPRWNAVTSVPYLLATFAGDQPRYLHRLHEIHGDVVRTTPNTLSFSSPDAAREIYSGRPGVPELRKDPHFYTKAVSGAYSILTTPSHADHVRYRRLLNPGFSDRAIREQEPTVSRYVDLLMQRLHENSARGAQNMVAWFNWTTFDLIGDLTFNQPFGCLDESAYHPWITFVFGTVKSTVLMAGLFRYPIIKSLLLILFGHKIQAARNQSAEFTKGMVEYRLASKTDRTDFLSHALQERSDKDFMTRAEIEATSAILILGGSETSATLLSGAVYYLLKDPHAMRKLVGEIRAEFQKEQEINMVNVSKLPYLEAVLKEALRIFPPVTLGSPRIVEGNPRAIGGVLVPPGVSIESLRFAYPGRSTIRCSNIILIPFFRDRLTLLLISMSLRTHPRISSNRINSFQSGGWTETIATHALQLTKDQPAYHFLSGHEIALVKSI